MALVTKATLEFDTTNKVLRITDATGAYNASTNPTGYGGGVNKPTSQAYRTTFHFVLPDGTTLDVDSNTGDADFYPHTVSEREFSPGDLGLSDFEDGVYQVQVLTWFTITAATLDASIIASQPTITATGSTFLSNIDGLADAVVLMIDSEAGAGETLYYLSVFNLVSDTVVQVVESSIFPVDPSSISLDALYAGYKSTNYVLYTKNTEDCHDRHIATLEVDLAEACLYCTTPKDQKERKYVYSLMDVWMGLNTVAAQFAGGQYSLANTNIRKLKLLCANLKTCC